MPLMTRSLNWRTILRCAVGILVLVNLAGLILSLAALDLRGSAWALARLAIWTGLYVYLARREKPAAGTPATNAPES